jgi:predicted RNA binding protein YcfA (HicA-like mRNA interferase family)
VKKRQLERHLRAHGCRRLEQRSRHEAWENPASGAVAVLPRHREIKSGTVRGICRQLGVPTPRALS